ncbi:hypothetical protein [Candidatus Sororendozoicomonas aggregata]
MITLLLSGRLLVQVSSTLWATMQVCHTGQCCSINSELTIIASG